MDRLDPIDLVRGHHARAAGFHSFTFVPPVRRLIRRQGFVDKLALRIHGAQHHSTVANVRHQQIETVEISSDRRRPRLLVIDG